jgi:short-subunit dehydrogenase
VRYSFDQKNIIITGAAGGIGSELATQLAAQGGRLGLISRREDRLRELCDQISQAGGTAAYAIADVDERSSVLAAVDKVRSQLGPIDMMIANAGVGDPDVIEPFETATFERLMRVNWFGLVYSIEAVLPAMLERGEGYLVAVSSLRAYRGLPGFAGYSASKAAINTLMEGLRVELRGRGIDVTTLCPGYVHTAMTEGKDFPKPFIMQPDDAARRMIAAVGRRRKVHNFPLPLTAMVRIGQVLPDWIIDRVAPRNPPAT